MPLTARRATLQSLALVLIFYGYLYGNAALRGNVSLEEVNVVLSAFVTGALMLLITGLLVRRDADWKDSLQLRPTPPVQAIAFGALGVVLSYAAGALAIGLFKLLGAQSAQMLAQKLAWASKFSGLPMYWVLPLSIFVGLWEEIVFRGFLLNRLKVTFRGDARIAVVVTGVLFGIGHGYQGVQGIVQTAAVGIALGAVTVWRKSLWPAVIAHLSIDTIGLVAIKVLKPLADDLLKHRLSG